MTKPLPAFQFDRTKLSAELAAFKRLLGAATKELAEQSDVLPFFKRRRNLAALIGYCYGTRLGEPDVLKSAYSVSGVYACDLAVGNSTTGEFCFVEFEDASRGSVFKTVRRGSPEWGARLEHGFGQIVDWFCVLDDLRNTNAFRLAFGSSLANYKAVLVIGREAHLTPGMRERLRWRSMNTLVGGSRSSS
jgi:hypothetical protein